MPRTMSYLSWTCAVVMVGSLIQCGSKKSESQKATFEIVPEKPIVITADTTVNGIPVAAPWVKFNVMMTNGSTRPITIVSVTATIYAPNTVEGKIWAEDPASQASTTGSVDCTYNSYGTFNPGDVKPLELPGSDACLKSPHAFYVGGLTKPATGSSYRYKIVLRPIGWFGTLNDPSDRFETQITFTTQ